MKIKKHIYSKGFTLIELLLVISILSVLSSITMASLNSARDKANVAAGQQFEGQVFRLLGSDDPVAIYTFDDGTPNDSSGNGDNLSSGCVSATYVPGILGTALSLTPPGSAYCFKYPGLYKNFNPLLGSISFWVKVAPSGVFHVYLGASDRINNSGGTNITAFNITSSATMQYGKWMHVLFAWNSTSQKLYINGKQDNTYPSAPNFTDINYSGDEYIYIYATGANVVFDRVAIYSKTP